MYSKFIAGSIITAAFLFAGAYASDQSATPAEKLDSGLGAVPPYSEWKSHPELSPLVAPATSAPAPGQLAAAKR